jgi:hypothetical protein
MTYGLATYEQVGDSSDLDDLVISEPVIKKFTLDTGAVVRGDLMGQISSGGKLIKSLSGAGDGSQTPHSIAAHDVDATAGDKDILVYVSGRFNQARVNYGTAHTAASVYEALRDKDILLEPVVLRYPNP